MPRSLFPLAILCSCVLGCSSAHIQERYHFHGKRGDEIVNYYRVDISGTVYGTQLRYLSGLFDEDALNRYFNTFAQPDKGALFPIEPTGQKTLKNDVADPPALPQGERREVDPGEKGRKLCLLLSQNSEIIAEQIGDIAQSEAFATVVGRLVFKEQLADASKEIQDAVRAERSLAAAKKAASDLVTLLADTEHTHEELLRFVNDTATALGAPNRFETVAAAEQWLRTNRARLLGGAK